MSVIKKYIFSIILLLCCGLLFSCKNDEKTISENREEEKTKQADGVEAVKKTHTPETGAPVKKETNKIKKIKSRKDKKGRLQFVFSMEDFISQYNEYYRNDKGSNYIQPYSEWYSYRQDLGKHKGAIHYEYTADKKMWTLPTITVYTDKNRKTIRELTVNFDDHSYTEVMYQKYEEICFYTLRVFFPEISEKKITRLYKKLNQSAYKNIFPNEKGFGSGNAPAELYYRNGVGVYPYFAYGESVRMCVVPVTRKVVENYRQRGTAVHKI